MTQIERGDVAMAFLVGDREARREVGQRMADLSAEQPTALAPVADILVELLSLVDTPLRQDLSYALFNLGGADAAAVEPHLDGLLAHLDDPSGTVRANLARPGSEIITRTPETVDPSQLDILLSGLQGDTDSERHSHAWALEALARRYPSRLADRYPLAEAVRDTNPPVVKHAGRTAAYLERWVDGVVDPELNRFAELLATDTADAAVRIAAAVALGAHGGAAATAALERARQPSTPTTVRRAAEHALSEAVYLDGVDRQIGRPVESAAMLDECACLSVAAVDAAAPTGRYRGFVNPAPDACPVWAQHHGADADRDGVVRLVNPFEGYVVDLRVLADRIEGQCRAHRPSTVAEFTAADLGALNPAVLPVGYAREGATLICTVNEEVYETDVVAATGQGADLVVRVRDEARGQEMEVRPGSRRPTRIAFRDGRTVTATAIELALPAAETMLVDGDTGHRRRSETASEDVANDRSGQKG
jgi:hypothetical protein